MHDRILDEGLVPSDVVGGGAATPADDVYQTFVDVLFYLGSHGFWCFVVFSETVGQSGIRIGTDVVRGGFRQLFQERFHVAGSE